MSYAIRITKKSQKVLSKIPSHYQENIITRIRNLSANPHPEGCKKLTGRDAWRIRVAQYRILYEINQNELIILIIKIGHRKDIYK